MSTTEPMNIIEWLLDEGIAHHPKQAANIANLLNLEELRRAGRLQEIEKRARAYRKFRDYTQDKPARCAERALNGEEPPKELFEVLA